VLLVHELRKYDIFLDLESNELAALARIADVVHASEGEAIIEEGQPARTFYVMDQGNLMIAFADGRALTLHGRGEVVGWSAIIHPTHYTGDVICLTDCSFIAFPGSELLRLVQSNVATGTKIMRTVSQRVANRIPFLAETVTRRLKGGR
jgi:CRP-like cAMP-binding protein